MKINNKAIILDLDETLISGTYKENEKKPVMTLRPNLDKLIMKLKEVKKQNVDIILCTF